MAKVASKNDACTSKHTFSSSADVWSAPCGATDFKLVAADVSDMREAAAAAPAGAQFVSSWVSSELLSRATCWAMVVVGLVAAFEFAWTTKLPNALRSSLGRRLSGISKAPAQPIKYSYAMGGERRGGGRVGGCPANKESARDREWGFLVRGMAGAGVGVTYHAVQLGMMG